MGRHSEYTDFKAQRHTCKSAFWPDEVQACRLCWYAVLRIIAREKGFKNYKKMRWGDIDDESIERYTEWVFI